MVKTTVKRWPRYPGAETTGNLAKKIWKRPRFRVKLTSDSTQFVFSLKYDLRKKIKKKNSALYHVLFDPKRTSLSEALIQAYGTAKSGQNKARDLCERALYKIFGESLAILFEEADRAQGLSNGILGYRGDASDVRQAAKRKQRPSDAERKICAKRIAKRYRGLFPEVKKLWRFVKLSPDRLEESRLRETVEKSFPYDWIELITKGAALQKFPETAGHYHSTDSLGKLKWTPRQLALGIIWCEERKRTPNFSVRPETMLKYYLPLGNKLNQNPK